MLGYGFSLYDLICSSLVENIFYDRVEVCLFTCICWIK